MNEIDILKDIDLFVLDMDGTFYLGNNIIDGSLEFLEAVKKVGMVVEGINALPAAVKLAAQYDVEMPIVSFMDGIINGGKDPGEAAAQLMGRKKKSELPTENRTTYFARILSETL